MFNLREKTLDKAILSFGPILEPLCNNNFGQWLICYIVSYNFCNSCVLKYIYSYSIFLLSTQDQILESWGGRKKFYSLFSDSKGPTGRRQELQILSWFPHRLLTGATSPPLSEEDPIRAPPASTSRPSYYVFVKGPSDSNCSKKIAFDIMFFIDNSIGTY